MVMIILYLMMIMNGEKINNTIINRVDIGATKEIISEIKSKIIPNGIRNTKIMITILATQKKNLTNMMIKNRPINKNIIAIGRIKNGTGLEVREKMKIQMVITLL